jgi:hypothetical protein
MPRLQHELVVEVLHAEPGMEVAHILDRGGAMEAITVASADVVVAGLPEHGSRDWLWAVLAANPRLKVVAIDPTGRWSSLCQLRIHATELREVSPRSLVAAIRDAAGEVR